jgi:hypothetical protein
MIVQFQAQASAEATKKGGHIDDKPHHIQKIEVTEPGTLNSHRVCHPGGEIEADGTFPSLPHKDGQQGKF